MSNIATTNIFPKVVDEEIKVEIRTHNFSINLSEEIKAEVLQHTFQIETDCLITSAKWGQIQGDIDNQTDLKDVLDSKADLVNGKVPASQLPSYVDDVLEFDTFADFPTTGETGKIYVDKEKNETYRWSGSQYVKIGSSGSKIGCQDFHYDFSQPDYDYVGGENKDGVFQINRYTKTQPITISYAFGDWNNRYSLTYTNI